ncbi:MAG TPA: ribbon-helix-helix domain-containing protein [Acidimicrobiales bacterium]|nr:ribbon-helix-helix domain-containing protein [Acidimicrobiales bacterium]
MKVSVSLPDEDVEFLDAYAAEQGFASRSAVLHKAVRLLKAVELGGAYEEAWRGWETTGEAEAWDTVAADGADR